MNIIYHFPLPLDSSAKSASGIRPVKMLEAFVSLGYSVDVVSGYIAERKKMMRKIRQKILSGTKYEFCYSESSTMPTLLTEKNHLPCLSAPDFPFFRFCKKNGIPVRLFYRDIYWCFKDYYRQVGIKGYVAKFFYKYDVRQYLKYLDTLYVPCMKMLDYVPKLKRLHCEELPPGCVIQGTERPVEKSNVAIYVGGIGGHYDMHKLISVYADMKNERLFFCVRQDDWEMVKDTYPLPENVQLVHASGDELKEWYQIPNKAMLFVEPSLYRGFAIPYKLFEYMGWGLPIVANEGTAVGEYVKKNDIGWTIPYTEESLRTLLIRLSENREEIDRKRINVNKAALKNTWEKRCEQVARRFS